MQRKTVIILIFCFSVFPAIAFGVSIYKKALTEPNPNQLISGIEAALGNEYKKQAMTELAATLTYGDANNENTKIYYHILKTTFYEGDPAETTGLHTEALDVLFPTENMDSCEKKKVQDRNAALYKKDEVAFFCWTYSPEVTYVLEYNPSLIDDSVIIKMAESVKLIE